MLKGVGMKALRRVIWRVVVVGEDGVRDMSLRRLVGRIRDLWGKKLVGW